jgi:putative glutamine amidotransferase
MAPRIAIPVPHSGDRDYAERALPQYEHAVEMAGGEPVRIPLDRSPAEVMKIIERCDGVVLPGSKADVDPAKFNAERSPQTAATDAHRDTVDELLLQDAYNMRKPILGICYGLQSLNVYRTGSLVQHIPNFLPEEKRNAVDHEAGRKVAVAHSVAIDPDSRLGNMVAAKQHAERSSTGQGKLLLPVNSSHHQSAGAIGDGLRVVGRCPDDDIVEALEGTAGDHFVLAVQWHPERSVDEDEASRAIFRALVGAARAWHEQLTGEFESTK